MANEVTAAACIPVLEAAAANGTTPGELVEGLPITIADLRRPGSRVSWADYAALLDRLLRAAGGLHAVERVGATQARRPASWLPAAACARCEPRELYPLWAALLAGSVFRNVSCRIEESRGSCVVGRLRIPDRDRESVPFFHLMLGVLRCAPRTIGLSDARVDMELAPRRAVYHIRLPRSGTLPGLLARARRFASPARALVAELADQHVELVRTREALQRANAALEEQIAARRSAQDRLRQAQKIEAVGLLANGIAHDFNNLLTAIRGNADLLVDQVSGNQAALADLEEIRAATDRASALTSKLLAFGRASEQQPVVLGLNEVVVGIEKVLRRLIGPEIRFHTRLDARRGNVRADPAQIEQVIMNLCVNARDAMPEGGELALTTDEVDVGEPDAAFAHAGVPPGRYVVLRVRDTGCGMPPEVRERIFEPFFTTKEPDKGTGLGLSTVYSVVEQSGGRVVVHSRPGAGSTFEVYLPRVAGPCAPRAARPSCTPRRRGRETVLVVESDDPVRRLACRALVRQGYTVLEAADAARAGALARRRGVAIDLLLTDVRLPQLDGRELVRRLRDADPALRVVYLGGPPDAAALEPIPAGARFVSKPFDPDSLVHAVETALRSP